MSEPASKQRLRRWTGRFTTTLTAHGWRVTMLEDGTFHLLARKGKTARIIRISFGYKHYDEIEAVRREPVPARCIREIWKISDDGKTIIHARIE